MGMATKEQVQFTPLFVALVASVSFLEREPLTSVCSQQNETISAPAGTWHRGAHGCARLLKEQLAVSVAGRTGVL